MKNYNLIFNGNPKGSYTLERLRSMEGNKSIVPKTLCQREGESASRPLEWAVGHLVAPLARGGVSHAVRGLAVYVGAAPFPHTRNGIMFPYPLMLASLVTALQLSDMLGIQPATRQHYRMSDVNLFKVGVVPDLVITNIPLILGAGLMARGAWAARESTINQSSRRNT